MLLIIFILTFFSVPSPVYAQELIPYQNNPVILKEQSHTGAVQPFIIKEQNQYSLWYADMSISGYRISRTQSSNGIDWYEKKDTSVTNRQNASDPFVIFENNKYVLYFASSDFGNISIWESTSADGVTYEIGTEKEILKADSSWEGTNLSCPSVLKENEEYYLFYAGSASGNWGIGLATSGDGQNWQKCPNNPFIAPGASGHIIKYNGVFYLYFQSPNGLEVQETSILDGCDTKWTNRHVIDSALRDPSPIQVGNDLWLYGTLPTANGYHIGLAANNTIFPPTYPIVIVPGMFASWNKQAILHNTNVPFDLWQLNSAVTEYDALMKTLENKGRIKNVNYFLFPYDWRAPLTTTIVNLNQFLEKNIWELHPHLPVQLIGHSLGGVVTRLYAQKNELKPIKNIVSAGSPLLGTVQSYKPLTGGEIDRGNTLMWMAEKLVLLLNKSKIESDKDTIASLFPVLKDLLPTFPYLKKEDGLFITSSLRNITLSDAQISSSIAQLYLGGIGHSTNAGYILGPRTALDTLLDIYPDGSPQSSWQEDGDGTVLSKSTLNQITPAPLSNHGETIFSKDNIKAILSSLNIQVQDSDIPVGKATLIFPAILTFIQSPATMEIEHNGMLEKENEGMIWIQNAENGTYSLKVTGLREGEYVASIWLIGESEDKWIQYKKTTSNGTNDIFTITFDTKTGGTSNEYIAPSPTTPPTLSSNTTTNSDSTSNSSVQPHQTTSLNGNSKQTSPILSFQKMNQATSFPSPYEDIDSDYNVLGVNTKSEQKKNINLYIAVSSLIVVLLTTVFVHKRKAIIPWLLNLWKKIKDMVD